MVEKNNEPKEISEETRLKISVANTGKIRSEEARNHYREAALKRPPMAEETKQKIRDARAKQVFSEEANKKRSESLKGHDTSEETRSKISKSNKGKKRTEEEREQMSVSQVKRFENPEERAKCAHPISEEQRKQISDVHTGLPHSEETKEIIRQTSKLRWEDPVYRKKIHDSCSGEKHWTVKHGVGLCDEERIYPLGFNKYLKEAVRKRDNYTCQWCGKSESEEGRKLSIHHIDHVRLNLESTNLITLCRKCNSGINGKNKQYWTNVFTFLMAVKDKQERLITTDFRLVLNSED